METGSWIAREHQGKGYGTESRAAVLELAFAHLRALEAYTFFGGSITPGCLELFGAE
ncbi:GNAT family N-acetyltransferase [Nonomuraea jabiensis]|uniref:GNAT family N-acetyltransferase n=1 Tax=Nonomuraea jabiensis TaxID=882448 RepID=UPI003D71888A